MSYTRTMKQALVVAAAAVAVATAAGCASQAGAQPSTPDPAAVAAELSSNASAANSATSGASTPAGSTIPSKPGGAASQRSSGGSVTIDVTWQNPKEVVGPVFSVVMDTHSVDLDGYDLGKLAVLRNDRGVEVTPEQWTAPAGGHHRSGKLFFPLADSAGKPILGDGAARIELVIRDVSGVKERVLKWEVSG